MDTLKKVQAYMPLIERAAEAQARLAAGGLSAAQADWERLMVRIAIWALEDDRTAA